MIIICDFLLSSILILHFYTQHSEFESVNPPGIRWITLHKLRRHIRNLFPHMLPLVSCDKTLSIRSGLSIVVVFFF